MLKMLTRVGLILAALGASSSAFGFVDVQLERGRRSISDESNGVKSGAGFNQTTLGAHLSFLPIVSFGATLSLFDRVKADLDSNGIKSHTGTELGLDVQAALSFVPIITPYARLNLPVMSTFAMKTDDGTKVESHGVPLETFWYTVGVQYKIIPLLAVMAEVGTGTYMAVIDKVDVDGENLATGHAKDRDGAKMDHVLVGLQLSL